MKFCQIQRVLLFNQCYRLKSKVEQKQEETLDPIQMANVNYNVKLISSDANGLNNIETPGFFDKGMRVYFSWLVKVISSIPNLRGWLRKTKRLLGK